MSAIKKINKHSVLMKEYTDIMYKKEKGVHTCTYIIYALGCILHSIKETISRGLGT